MFKALVVGLGIAMVGVLVGFGYMLGSGSDQKTRPISFSLQEMKLTEETSYLKAVVVSVVEGEESHLGGLVKPKLTMLAVADCRFGIDFVKHQLKATPSGRSITIQVIEPYNMGCEPSLAKSRFIQGGSFIPPSKDLYNSLGVKAAEEIGREAVKLGYQEQARESAQAKLEALFRKAGFEEVKIVFIKP